MSARDNGNDNIALMVNNDRLIDAYGQVRGLPDDRRWAVNAAYALSFRQHAAPDRVHEALAEQLSEFRDTAWHGAEWQGEDSPGDSDAALPASALFGEPDQWAAQQAARWREDGIDAFDYSEGKPEPVRNVLVSGFAFGALITMLFWVFMLFRVQDWSLPATRQRALLPTLAMAARTDNALAEGWIALSGPLLPLLIALSTVAVGAIYRRVLSERSFTLAVLGAGTAFVGAVAVGTTVAATADAGPRIGFGWMPVVAVVYGIVAYAIARLWNVPASRSEETVADDLLLGDDEWLAELARLLRERNDMTDRVVARICDDARAHAAQSAASLAEEFGSPREYAHRFGLTPVSAGREAAYWAFAVLFAVIGILWHAIGDGTVSWWSLAQLGIFLLGLGLAVYAWRRRKVSSSQFYGPQKS